MILIPRKPIPSTSVIVTVNDFYPQAETCIVQAYVALKAAFEWLRATGTQETQNNPDKTINKTSEKKASREILMSHIQQVAVLITASLLCAGSVSAQSDRATIEKALSPLPMDLRADATVYTYDDAGNRVTLKAGSNHVECQPTDEEGFTRCGPVSQRARRDLQANLSAQGMEGDDLQLALQKAEDEGRIPPRQFGALSYRRFDTPNRIQYLFVVSLPNATAAELGMPEGSQRDNSLAGRGTPWMMRSGTSGAHLMIPVNGTDYSNEAP